MDEKGDVLGYTEIDVNLLNRMVQSLLSCLPDEYRKIAEVESQPVSVKPSVSSDLVSQSNVWKVVPISVAVNPPNGDHGQVSFVFGVEMGVEGIFRHDIINVFMTGSNGERDSISFDTGGLEDDIYERTKVPMTFSYAAMDFVEHCFGEVSDIVSMYPSFIEAAGVADDGFMTNLISLLPDGWDVVFHQSILDGFGIPFVDSFTATHGDDFILCPVHVSRIGNDCLHVKVSEDEYPLVMILSDEPIFMCSKMQRDMEPIVAHLLEGVDVEQEKGE